MATRQYRPTIVNPAYADQVSRALAVLTPQAAAGPTTAQRDAKERIAAILDSYGLGGLNGLAWDLIVQGSTDAEIMRRIRETPEYDQRFGRVNKARQAAGLLPKTEAEIMNYESQYAELMHAAGLPAGFYDSYTDFQDLIAGDVSVNELAQRVADARQVLYEDDPEVRHQLSLMGADEGAQIAWVLDPNQAMPAIQRQIDNARIGATSIRTGFGQLGVDEMDRLRGWGVDAQAATQGFNALTQQEELFNPLPGFDNEQTIGRQDQLSAAFGGDAQAQQTISRRAKARKAASQSGGQYAATTTGVLGLGSAAN